MRPPEENIAVPSKTDSAMTVDERTKIREGLGLNPNPIVYNTQQIYDRYGTLTTVYTEGPKAGRDVQTGDLVIQGPVPSSVKEAEAKAAADKLAAEIATANAKTQAELAAATAARIKAEADAAKARADLAKMQSTPPVTPTPTVSAPAIQTAADLARVDAIEAMKARFKQYGLEGLVAKIKDLAISGASETTITLQLQETPEYKTRFAANESRIKKGLQVLSPGEYLTMEDTYRQTLRAYGLTQFDNDAYVKQFIANDVSPTELSNRVVTAVQRVRNADPAIATQLREYYGVGQEDLIAYVLDPEQQFQKIQRQVAASEIGVAAGRQGLKAGVGVAEQLAAQGVTQAEAQKGYATIADILPTAEKLSSIYGTTMDGYGQSEAEQEVFNSLASAQRTRQKLTAREVAAFSGAAGTSKASLASQTRGSI